LAKLNDKNVDWKKLNDNQLNNNNKDEEELRSVYLDNNIFIDLPDYGTR
jgi:hypothetical protein